MSFDINDFDRSYGTVYSTQETIGQFATRTFLWMFLGLMITFGTSLAFFLSRAYYVVFSVQGLHLILLVVELIVAVSFTG